MATNGTLPRTRVNWVDTARFIAILMVQIFHFIGYDCAEKDLIANASVQCFFLLSGCMSNFDKENNFLKFIIKKAKRLLVPMFVFGALSIINYCSVYATVEPAKDMLAGLIKGCIRNRFFAMQLWFFSCLFVIEIVFKLISYLKNKWIVLAVTVALFSAAYALIEPKAIAVPHIIYNIDSALYYIIYYAIGYAFYPAVLNLFCRDTKAKRVIFDISAVVSALFTLFAFFLLNIPVPSVFNAPYQIIRSLIAVWTILCTAKLVENVGLFSSLGRETLYLCGNEYIIKLSLTAVFEVCGIKALAYSAVSHYSVPVIFAISFLMLLFSAKIVIPAEKYIIGLTKKLVKVKSK